MVPLSPREAEVLRLNDEGKSCKEIAAQLGISIHTLRCYAKRILIKTAAVCLREAAFRIGGPRIPAQAAATAPKGPAGAGKPAEAAINAKAAHSRNERKAPHCE